MNISNDAQKSGMKLLMLFLASFVLISSAAKAQDISERNPGLFVTQKITRNIAVAPQNKLTIESAASLSGSIKILTANQAGITVTFVKVARTSERSRAFDFIDLISVNLTVSGDRAKLVMRAPNPARWGDGPESGEVEAVVTVPVNCHVEIEAVAFDVITDGPLSALIIPRSLGRIDARGIHGTLNIRTHNRKVTLENISGTISVATSNSSLYARSIVTNDDIAHFKNEGGSIKIVDFKGSLNVRNTLGRIDVYEFIPSGEANFISGSSAPIRIDIITMSEGQLVVKNRDEDIEISVPDFLPAYYFLSVGDNGQIDTSNLPVRTELVRPGRLNLVSAGGGVDISASIRGEGNIYLRGQNHNDE